MRIIQMEESPIIEPGDTDRRIAKLKIHPEMYETVKWGSGNIIVYTNDTAEDTKYVQVLFLRLLFT
jgi:hypothetical protein